MKNALLERSGTDVKDRSGVVFNVFNTVHVYSAKMAGVRRQCMS